MALYMNKNASTMAWAFLALLLVAVCAEAAPKPAPEEISTIEEEPEIQSSAGAQVGISSEVGGESVGLPISKPKFVCNPKCAAYAEEYQVRKFRAERCCTFIPCPQTNYDPAEYARFRKRVCPRVGKCD